MFEGVYFGICALFQNPVGLVSTDLLNTLFLYTIKDPWRCKMVELLANSRGSRMRISRHFLDKF